MKTAEFKQKIMRPAERFSTADIESLSRQADVPALIARLLLARGIDSPDKAYDFFHPRISLLHDPFLLKGMKLAVERIREAILERENIAIYGDYDVDGLTATSLLFMALRKLGASVKQYIPNRFFEGYGISIEGIKELKKWGTSLLISVDTGITAEKEVDYANSQGMDVIITDHHLPHTGYPRSLAIINPKQRDGRYPDKNLCGVGVSFKLAEALYSTMEMDVTEIYNFLDLVSIGTTADIVPLIGENRTMVQLGFQLLSRTQNPGIIAMLEQNNLLGKRISSYDVGYKIAPMLNAVGRLGNPEKSVKLLTEYDTAQVKTLAADMFKENLRRKELDRSITEECFAMVDTMDLSQLYFIVLASKNWHEGVVGIVASRISEKYNRPALIIALDGDGTGKGSARSIGDFHLVEALKKCEHLLVRFGGHKYAAGLTVEQENIPVLKSSLNEIAQKLLMDTELVPKICPELEIEFSEIDINLVETLKRFEPFGPGNSKPLFITSNVSMAREPRILSGAHLKARLRQGGRMFDGVFWNQVDKLGFLESRSSDLTIVYFLELNEWNNKRNIQLNIQEIE
jgi:single-stranded-DNA-specific exonuclease